MYDPRRVSTIVRRPIDMKFLNIRNSNRPRYLLLDYHRLFICLLLRSLHKSVIIAHWCYKSQWSRNITRGPPARLERIIIIIIRYNVKKKKNNNNIIVPFTGAAMNNYHYRYYIWIIIIIIMIFIMKGLSGIASSWDGSIHIIRRFSAKNPSINHQRDDDPRRRLSSTGFGIMPRMGHDPIRLVVRYNNNNNL